MALSEELLRSIDFIDYDKAMEYCAGMPELLSDAISDYTGTDSRYNELLRFFEEKNWDEYRVCIHAVKSSSLLIGIGNLYEHAKALESAVRENNIQYVFDHHEEVMAEYKNVLDVLTNLSK